MNKIQSEKSTFRTFLKWFLIILLSINLLLVLWYWISHSWRLVPQKVIHETSVNVSPIIKAYKLDALNVDTLDSIHGNNAWGLCGEEALVEELEYALCDTFEFSLQPKATRKPNQKHCVEYADAMAQLLNYGFRRNHLNAQAYHVRGTITFWGMDICKLLGHFSKSFKDHDWVIVAYDSGLNFCTDHTTTDSSSNCDYFVLDPSFNDAPSWTWLLPVSLTGELDKSVLPFSEKYLRKGLPRKPTGEPREYNYPLEDI